MTCQKGPFFSASPGYRQSRAAPPPAGYRSVSPFLLSCSEPWYNCSALTGAICLVFLSSHSVRKYVTLWLFEKHSQGSRTWWMHSAVLFLVILFVFFSEKPNSGLCLRHPAMDTLLLPQPSPLIAYSNFTQGALHWKGNVWQDKERTGTSTHWSADPTGHRLHFWNLGTWALSAVQWSQPHSHRPLCTKTPYFL